MISGRLRWRWVWFVSTWAYFSSSVVATRLLESEKFAKHDKNWWFWNQEDKERSVTSDDFQVRGKTDEQKLVIKKSVHHFKSTLNPLHTSFSREPPAEQAIEKRWLTKSFGFGSKKRTQAASDKLIDDEQSGMNAFPVMQVAQDPLLSSKGVDKPSRKFTSRTRFKARKLRVRPQIKSSEPIKYESAREKDVGAIHLNRSKHLNSNERFLHPDYRQQIVTPAEQIKLKNTFGDLNPTRPSSINPQLWDRFSTDSFGRYISPFGELKFNPLKYQFPFQDRRSTVRGQPTPNFKQLASSEPPFESQSFQDASNLSQTGDRRNERVIENKEKSKTSKKMSKDARGSKNDKYDLVPKVYTIDKIGTRRKNYELPRDRCRWSEEFDTVVPSFRRKQTEVESSIRPYIIRSENRLQPFDDEYIQVSRANRNQTKNILNINDSNKVTGSAVPVQIPNPYAFPGGVNISILVPNPPPSTTLEMPLSTMTSTSTDKNNKKKKERKKKGKNDDESMANEVISEPRSYFKVVEQNPHSGENRFDSIGNHSGKVGLHLTDHIPHVNNSFPNLKHPLLDLQGINFSLLNHVRNLSLDNHLFGIQTDKIWKLSDYSEEDEEDDDIRMLYDEQTSSSSSASPEIQQMGQTVSFSWYTNGAKTSRYQEILESRIMNSGTWPNFKHMTGFESEEYATLKGDRQNSFIKRVRWPSNSRKEQIPRQPWNFKIGLTGDEKPLEKGIPTSLKFQRSCGRFRKGEKRDQWDTLDEDLENDQSEKSKGVAWKVKNSKREADYENQCSDGIEGYYRLSAGDGVLRNPTNFIMSAFKSKSGRRRGRDYYDDLPEEGRAPNGETQ